MTEAFLRQGVVNGVRYIAADDLAAVLLDTAQTVEEAPEAPTTAAVLRSLAAGFAALPDPPRKD